MTDDKPAAPRDWERINSVCDVGQAAAPAPVEVAPRAFEYLLNAMELAAQEDCPADHGYKAKREAVFAYVAKLAAEKAEAEATDWYVQAKNAREMAGGMEREAREWRARAEAAEHAIYRYMNATDAVDRGMAYVGLQKIAARAPKDA